MIPKNEAIKKGVTIIDSKQSRNALVETLKANFPQVIKDNQVDLKAIATLLGLNDKADIQGYELTFTGKGLANALYSTPTQKLLTLETSFIPPHSIESVIARQSQSDNEAIQNIESTCHTEPLGEVSKSLESSPQTPQNFIIRGDNLDALKILKSAYTEKIKMIYIDPPYNTKNENFIYPDNFRKDYQAILQEVGLLEIDENGEEKESETLKFFRNIQGSRTHSGWLAFMLPRLKLARDLLKDDGVIFISIDDNEQANLKILCDEIFGEENFVSCFVWQKKSGGGQAKFFYEGHEYVLIYAKNKNNLQGLYKAKQKAQIDNDFIRKVHGKYTNNSKLKALYKKYPNDLIEHRNLMFEELDIFLKEQMITQEKYDEIKENLTKGVYFLNSYNDKFNLICRYNESDQSLMYSILIGFWTSDGNTEIENIFGKNIFKDPKPTNLVKQLIQSATMINKANSVASLRGGGGGNSRRIA